MRILLLLLLGFLRAPVAAEPSGPEVVALDVEGVINPAVSAYIESGLAEAKNRKAAAVLIRLDTPGGLLDATRSTVSAMINAEIPVIVYVSPRGSRATSAGVFLMMAADVAAMAPETHLGAAHPVTIGGDDKRQDEGVPAKEKGKGEKADKKQAAGSAMEEKMVSDAAAYIRTLAKERNRNAEWAERAVRESVSLTAEEALKQKVIDVLATSREELFQAVDGRVVKKGGKSVTLKLQGAATVPFDMTATQRALHLLAHPNVAYILLTIGIYGLIYELAAPGIGLGGAVGAICLLLAFFSLQVLPLNVVGVSLLALGVLLLIMELLAPSHGLLTFGGLLAFAIGSFFMVDAARGLNYPRVSLTLILPTVLTTALLFGIALRKAFAARRARPRTGVESLLGSEGEARSAIAPEGMVFLQGELWTARSSGPTLGAGDKVRVLRVEGNTLIVEKAG